MPNKNQGRAAKPRPKSDTKKTKTRAAKAIEPEVSISQSRVPSAVNIAKASWLIIWRNRKAFSLIILIYGLVYLVLVLGLSGPANVASIKKEFSGAFHGHLGSLDSSISVFTYLVGSTTSSSTASGSAYQLFIVIVASLSIIWALRQSYQGGKFRARDSYYQGLYPLVQYVLVVLFIILELLPMAVGLGLYSLLINGNIAVTAFEKLLSIILVLVLAGLSLYLISSSTMALYIATLPSMTPLKALRSAKELVKGRRWIVLRKIIFLPVLLFIVSGLIMLPFILVAPALSAWIFFLITLIALTYIHSYLYSLYRSLINE